MSDIKVGDEVRVLSHRNRYGSFPEDGYEGTITKVARKYATVTYFRQRTAYPPGPVEETLEFDMETGAERGGYGGYGGYYVRTPEQLERDKRRKAALFLIKEAGVDLRYGRPSRLTLEQLEALAEVVKTWDQED